MATGELQQRLVTAAQQGDHKQVKRLLKHGGRANVRVTIGCSQQPLLHEVLSWCDEETLRYRFHDYAEVIKALVRAGAPLEARDELGNTALMQACLAGQLRIIRLLLHLGANPNAANEDGETPLTATSDLGPPEAVRELIRWGADVNHRTRDGYTPLMFAAGKAFEESVRYLLEAGGTQMWCILWAVSQRWCWGHAMGSVWRLCVR